jgi:hypothetical protein
MPRLYSPAIQPLMQNLLATLADIDFAHQREVERVTDGSGDERLKSLVVGQLRSAIANAASPTFNSWRASRRASGPRCRDVAHGRNERDAA